jgi:plastocyanin
MPMRYLGCVILMLACSLPARPQESVLTGHVALLAQDGKAWRGSQGDTAVWLVPLSTPTQPPAQPKAAPRLVQKNKSFEPRIVILTAGTAVEFPNRDPFFHNVFSLFDGKRFDLGLYEAGGTRMVHFDKAGISYIFCNIHPEMSAVVVAVATPYYALTDRAGNVSLKGVPPGRYMLHLWNERAIPGAAEAATRELTIAAGSASFGTIPLAISVAPEPAHKNKYGRDYDPSAPSNPIYEQP